MITEERKKKLYPVFAGGASLATASAIASTVWTIYALSFVLLGQLGLLKDGIIFVPIGVFLSLVAGVASYRWSFNYYKNLKKDT